MAKRLSNDGECDKIPDLNVLNNLIHTKGAKAVSDSEK